MTAKKPRASVRQPEQVRAMHRAKKAPIRARTYEVLARIAAAGAAPVDFHGGAVSRHLLWRLHRQGWIARPVGGSFLLYQITPEGEEMVRGYELFQEALKARRAEAAVGKRERHRIAERENRELHREKYREAQRRYRERLRAGEVGLFTKRGRGLLDQLPLGSYDALRSIRDAGDAGILTANVPVNMAMFVRGWILCRLDEGGRSYVVITPAGIACIASREMEREKRLAYKREWTQRNREHVRRCQKIWRQRFKERHPGYKDEWSKAHPDLVAAAKRKWRARRHEANMALGLASFVGRGAGAA